MYHGPEKVFTECVQDPVLNKLSTGSTAEHRDDIFHEAEECWARDQHSAVWACCKWRE